MAYRHSALGVGGTSEDALGGQSFYSAFFYGEGRGSRASGHAGGFDPPAAGPESITVEKTQGIKRGPIDDLLFSDPDGPFCSTEVSMSASLAPVVVFKAARWDPPRGNDETCGALGAARLDNGDGQAEAAGRLQQPRETGVRLSEPR